MGVRSRVESAFGSHDGAVPSGPDYERLEKYIDYLLNSWGQTLAQVRRNLLYGLFTVFVFLLFATRTVGEVSVLSIKVSHDSVLTTFMPTLAAYFFLEVIATTIRADQQRAIFSECVRLWSPDAWKMDLEDLLYPEQPLFFAPATVMPTLANASSADRALDKIGMALLGLVFFIPTVFEIFAFVSLFDGRGADDWILWINAAITLLLIACYWWLAVAASD